METNQLKAKARYQRSAGVLFLVVWLLGGLLFANRPPFPIFPYGIAMLALAAIAVTMAVRAYRRRTYLPWEFRVLTVCVASFCCGLVAEVVAHISEGNNAFYVRPLMTLAYVLVLWFGEKRGYWH